MLSNLIKKLETYPTKRIGLILFITAFILRFGYVIYAYFNNITDTFVDSLLYYNLGKAIILDGPIFYNTDFHRMADAVGPGLPWIIALTFLVLGKSWLNVFLISCIVSSFITLLTFKIACLVTNKITALIAGTWSCFYLFYFKFSATAGKDIWMSFLLILLIYFLIILFYKKKFSYPKFILFIFIYVFSFHLDERFLMLAPFIFIYILISETSFFSLIKLSKSIIFVLSVILLIIPWSIRNYYKYNKFILLTTRTEHITDKILGYEQKEYIVDNINNLYGIYYIRDNQIDSIIAGLKTVTDGGYKISEEQRQAIIKGKIPKPFTFIEAFWVRTKEFFRPFQIGGEYQKTGYFYYKKSLRHNIASFLFYGIMFLFSIPGFLCLYKKDKNIFYLFLCTIFIYTLIHSFFIPFTIWRYRLPLDALFIIVGCFGLNNVYKNIIRLI